MLFRFVITWSLIVALVGAYQPAASYNEEAITLGNLVPYEKFVEGDVIEPLLLGQYQLTENVSPYIPASFLASLSSAAYQTPANSYEPPKPMPANFNVYTAKNPTPVQYKPAPPVYGQPPAPAYPSVSYAPPAPSAQYAPASYAAPPPPPPPVSPYPAVSYGVNYEHNKVPLYVPAASYPAGPQSYLVPPPAVGYPPFPSYMPTLPPPPAIPAVPEASKANETEKLEEKIEVKVEAALTDPPTPSPLPSDSAKPAVSAIPNEAPAVKPTDKLEKKVQGKPTKTEKKLPVEPVKPPVPVPPKYSSGYPRANLTGKSQRFTDPRVTGYRYLAQPNRRRSAPAMYSQASPARNQQYYRSSPAYPAYMSASPYAPSVSYSDSANQTANYYKRAAYANQHKATAAAAAAKDSRRRAGYGATYSAASPGYGAASSGYGAASPGYGAASPGYGAASPGYGAASPKTNYPAASTAYPQQASVYNENNVAESVLRGYSVNPEENNNKAIVRVFEEASYAIYFDIRVCDLKKDHLYSIYIHDYGQLTAGCESAGGQFGSKDTYFNPILGLRTNPSGFIGSFKYNGENLNIQHFSKRLLLSSIIGRAIVIHEVQTNQKVLPEAIENNMLNTFTMLMNPLSSPLVTSKRVACGVIGRANPYSFLRPPNQSCEIEVPVVEEKPAPELDRKREVKDVAELDPKKEIKLDSLTGLPESQV